MYRIAAVALALCVYGGTLSPSAATATEQRWETAGIVLGSTLRNVDECQGCDWGVQPGVQTDFIVWFNEYPGDCVLGFPHCFRCYDQETSEDAEGLGSEAEVNCEERGGGYACWDEFGDCLDSLAYHTTCSDCDSPSGELAVTAAMLADARLAELAHLIESSNGAVWLNRDRYALQGLGCADRLALHIPLGPSDVKILNSELARFGTGNSVQRWPRRQL